MKPESLFTALDAEKIIEGAVRTPHLSFDKQVDNVAKKLVCAHTYTTFPNHEGAWRARLR